MVQKLKKLELEWIGYFFQMSQFNSSKKHQVSSKEMCEPKKAQKTLQKRGLNRLSAHTSMPPSMADVALVMRQHAPVSAFQPCLCLETIHTRCIVWAPEGKRVSGVTAFRLFHSARTQSIGNSHWEHTRTHTPSSPRSFSRLFFVGSLLQPPIQHVRPHWPMCRRGFSA